MATEQGELGASNDGSFLGERDICVAAMGVAELRDELDRERV
jgi:hypothetical protein